MNKMGNAKSESDNCYYATIYHSEKGVYCLFNKTYVGRNCHKDCAEHTEEVPDGIKKLKPLPFSAFVLTKEILEDLAGLEHEQWAHWTKYSLNNLTLDNLNRWNKQTKTPYSDLTEKEKQSDREWVFKVLKVLLLHGVEIRGLERLMKEYSQIWEFLCAKCNKVSTHFGDSPSTCSYCKSDRCKHIRLIHRTTWNEK